MGCRTVLTLMFLGCVVGAFASWHFGASASTIGSWLVIGVCVLVLLGLAQQLAEWLGLDDAPRRVGPVAYFVDADGDVIARRPARGRLDVGDTIKLDGVPWSIEDSKRDDDGDWIYRVS